jgi:putative colanic acid biosynthesis UDP-glucose lipid carrier transferase
MLNKPHRLYRYSQYIKLAFLLGDIILLNAASVFSYLLRYGNIKMMDGEQAQTTLFINNIIWIGVCLYFKAFSFMRVGYIETIFKQTTKLLALHLFILLSVIVFLDYDDVSRLRIVYFTGIFFMELLLFRFLFLQILKYFRKAGYNFRNVVIIGACKKGQEMAQLLKKDLSYGYHVLGFFDNSIKQSPSEIPILDTITNAKTYLSNHPVHEVYIAISPETENTLNDLIFFCEQRFIRLKFIPDFQNYTKSKRVHIDFYDQVPVISLRKEPLESVLHRFIKRSFDVCFSLVVIVLVFTWLFPLLILLIKLSSKGPVFFKQQRSGENNQNFWCLKFRTMRVNNLSDELQATRNDSRITRIGKFLRKSNLDELPQFFNVFVGSMSVVGPRPHMLKHTEQYSELIHTYLVRHLIKPGITGWAQVNGYRGETNTLEQMQKRVEYDIWYIENWSLFLDFKIIFKTITNMFKGEKNAF